MWSLISKHVAEKYIASKYDVLQLSVLWCCIVSAIAATAGLQIKYFGALCDFFGVSICYWQLNTNVVLQYSTALLIFAIQCYIFRFSEPSSGIALISYTEQRLDFI